MKMHLKLSLMLAVLTTAAACSNGGGNNNPIQPGPIVPNNAACLPVNGVIPNPQLCNQNMNPNFNPNGVNSQSVDIGVLQQGGQPIIRNRQFHLSRGFAVERTDDSCTVDKLGDHVNRDARRPLVPGNDDVSLNFDQMGTLTISVRTAVGEVRSSAPVPYFLDGRGIQIGVGAGAQVAAFGTQGAFSLVGQPSAAYVQLESSLGFGMLRATDKKMRDDYDITGTNNPFLPGGNYATPTFSGVGSSYNPNYNLNAPNGIAGQPNQMAPNGQRIPGTPVNGGINGQPVNGFNNNGIVGNGVNELSMTFNVISARILTYPINPQHVLGIYLDNAGYQASSVVAITGTTCTAVSTGQLLSIELR